jgi:hypothetical protein
MRYGIAALIALLGIAAACRESVTRPEAVVPRPRFVSAAADSAAAETGIDAVPEEDAIFMQWYRDAALSGFELYRRREGEKEFARLASLSSSDSSFLDRAGVGPRCYYYLRGVDESGRLSAPSDTADYQLLDKATALLVTAADTLRFSWGLSSMRPAAYLLRLEEDESGAVIWISSLEPAFSGTRESAFYNQDGRAKRALLPHGIKYRWRVDCVGASPHSGSESAWQRFTLL